MLGKEELGAVRRLALKSLAFFLPFGLFLLALMAVDPFNYFGISHVVDQEAKEKTAFRLHDTLRKGIEFERTPIPNILLGDSLMNMVRSEMVESTTQEPYFNFSFGGGTIPEVIDAFWFADEHVDLDRVYIGVGFINFSVTQNMNRFPEATAMLANPLLYLTNRVVIKSAAYSLWSSVTGVDPGVGRPKGSKEAFWKQQIGGSTTALYRRFKYQGDFVEGLREIATHCAANGIQLTFVILPTHTDLQEKIHDFDLEATYDRFHRDVLSLGNVIDFNFPNDFTRSKENFKDPYHVSDPSMVIEAIWGGNAPEEFFRRYDAVPIARGQVKP